MAFTHTKIVDTGSFIKVRIRIRNRFQTSGSDQKGLDPTGSGSATLVNTVCIERILKFFSYCHCLKTTHVEHLVKNRSRITLRLRPNDADPAPQHWLTLDTLPDGESKFNISTELETATVSPTPPPTISTENIV
jgi:hypothetical protein